MSNGFSFSSSTTLGTILNISILNGTTDLLAIPNVSLPIATVSIIKNFTQSSITDMVSISFDDGVPLFTIPANIFSGIPGLVSVNIPQSLMTLGSFAFAGCTQLQTVDINLNANLQVIGGYAFSQCAGLSSINIPISVGSISVGAFASCSNLSIVDMDGNKSLVSLYNGIFSGLPIGSINIPSPVTVIGSSAFCNCSNLSIVNILEIGDLATICDSAFENCPSISSINIPSNVLYIEDNAFENDISLTSINIPFHVQSIGNNAFYNCSKISVLNFISSGSLHTIGIRAFEHIDIQTLVIPTNITSIGTDAFQSCLSLVTATVPTNATFITIGQSIFDACPSLTLVNGTTKLMDPSSDMTVWVFGENSCFRNGTNILTPHGYEKVENLCENDYVTTSKNKRSKIISIISFNANPENNDLYVIKKNSIGKNVPSDDLFISGGHSIKNNNKWVHAMHSSFAKKADIGNEITNYYHIVLEDYINDNIIANGLEVESCFLKNYNNYSVEWSCVKPNECVRKIVKMYN